MEYLSKYLLLLLLSISLSCTSNDSTVKKDAFKPYLVALFVADIEASINWYTEKLGFEVEKETEAYPDYGLQIAFLESNGFHLELIEKTGAIAQTDFLPSDQDYLGGVFKIGLRTGDLEQIYNHLKKFEDVEFITGIGDLAENELQIDWPTKHLLIKDPDGNFIQFFNAEGGSEITPWLSMVTVKNLSESISWYTENLGFKHHQTVGNKGNRRAVLERNDCVLELFEPEKVITAENVSTDTTILGFRKIAFGMGALTSFSSALEKKNVEVVMPLDKSDFAWANKAMIIKDLEGNWIQFFEISE